MKCGSGYLVGLPACGVIVAMSHFGCTSGTEAYNECRSHLRLTDANAVLVRFFYQFSQRFRRKRGNPAVQ
jgi:hypothetical protein